MHYDEVLEFLKRYVIDPVLVVYRRDVLYATVDLHPETLYEIAMRLTDEQMSAFERELGQWWDRNMPDGHTWILQRS